MALRAVIFDYGMVFTGPPDCGRTMRWCASPACRQTRFETLYWTDRHAYDEGKLTGVAFWQKFLRDAGLDLGPRCRPRTESSGCPHVDHPEPRDGRVADTAQSSMACAPPSSRTWVTRCLRASSANSSGSTSSTCWSGATNCAWPSPTLKFTFIHCSSWTRARRSPLPRRQAGKHRRRPSIWA